MTITIQETIGHLLIGLGGIILAVMLCRPAVLLAGPVTIPHTFVNGQVSDAEQVNANFTVLEGAVNDNDSRILDLEAMPFWIDDGRGNIFYNDGNVGIGTESPKTKLDVTDGGLNGQLLFNPDEFSDPAWGVINLAPSDNRRYLTGGVGTSIAVFKTDAPQGYSFRGGENFGSGNELDINLGVELVRINLNGDISANGNISAEAFTQNSSRAYKENITALSPQAALQAFKRLKPITFHYKADKKKDLHVGFIAEEVPGLVATPDRKGLSAMDIVAVLTKVVQQQQVAIRDQQSQIEALESQLRQLTTDQ